MEYGFHNPRTNVITWCPFVPCTNCTLPPISVEIDCGFTTGARSSIRKASCLFALTLYPLQEWTKNHTRRSRNPSLPSLFPSHDSLRWFLHFICSQYIHQGPPSNNVLAEAAVTHRGLNELCPSVLHSPSSIIHLSQGGTEVFRGFSLRNEITTLLKNAPLPRAKIDHKNAATHWTLSVLRIMRNVT